MRRLLITGFVLFSASPVLAGEDCTCKYQDYDVPEGQTICMQTPNGSKMATCSRVLNNTSWKFLNQECPHAYNSSNQSPKTLQHADIKRLLSAQES